jgi:hypothetical protein
MNEIPLPFLVAAFSVLLGAVVTTTVSKIRTDRASNRVIMERAAEIVGTGGPMEEVHHHDQRGMAELLSRYRTIDYHDGHTWQPLHHGHPVLPQDRHLMPGFRAATFNGKFQPRIPATSPIRSSKSMARWVLLDV